MKLRELKRAAFAVICSGTLLYGGNLYIWDGGGGNSHWDNELNWHCISTCVCIGECYPKTLDDDAFIPSAQSQWLIELITEEIDKLRITEDVLFAKAEANPTLTVNMLRIVGPATVEVLAQANGATIFAKGIELP